jgi:hypothetical protein
MLLKPQDYSTGSRQGADGAVGHGFDSIFCIEIQTRIITLIDLGCWVSSMTFSRPDNGQAGMRVTKVPNSQLAPKKNCLWTPPQSTSMRCDKLVFSTEEDERRWCVCVCVCFVSTMLFCCSERRTSFEKGNLCVLLLVGVEIEIVPRVLAAFYLCLQDFF